MQNTCVTRGRAPVSKRARHFFGALNTPSQFVLMAAHTAAGISNVYSKEALQAKLAKGELTIGWNDARNK